VARGVGTEQSDIDVMSDFEGSGATRWHPGTAVIMAFDITLEVAPIQQKIVVSGGKPLSVEPDQDGGSTLLENAGLSGLPDDPDNFEAALRALAGPGTIGAGNAQIFVNGLINLSVPSKESVQEVRINATPFEILK